MNQEIRSPIPPAIRTALASWFPELDATSWQLLGEGFGSVVLEHPAANLICRLCRTTEAGSRLLAIRTVAGLIPESAPFAVPRPVWSLPASVNPVAPYGAIAYRKLPGIPLNPHLCREATLPSIIDCLVHIHTTPLDMPDARNLRTWHQEEQHRHQTWRAIRDVLRHRLTPSEFRTVETWQQTPAPEPPAHCLVHGDFWQENLLIEPTSGAITGILDWENAHCGDPAIDFSPLNYPDPRFAREILTGYLHRTGHDDATFTRRVQWHWQGREFSGIYLSLLMEDEEELTESIEKLRNGGLLSP